MSKVKVIWYILFYLLFGFLLYYIISSSILIVQYAKMNGGTKNILIVIENFAILFIELFSAFYSIFIYYYIGSSSDYKIPITGSFSFSEKEKIPSVSIIIPAYKEPLVVLSQTIEGALNVDYPKNFFEVIIADDTPEGENNELRDFCQKKNVKYIHRENRKGFKAGAINNALKQISSDYIALLDSDHIPTENFLKTCLSGFTDEKIIFVQGKPMFVNQDNYMQRSSAFIHSQFFHIMQKSRATRHGVVFAGTTGVFKTKLVKEVGGFLEDTLAEDTDTSFVLIAKGYKSNYIHEICSNGLVPWTPIGMINQVWRWTYGISQIFVKRTIFVLRGKGSFLNKIDMVVTSVLPAIGVSMWFANFFILLCNYFLKVPFIRSNIAEVIPLLILAPILVAFANLVMGIVTWIREEKEDRMIRLRGFWGGIWTITAFYILMLTAQSFLLWAVISAFLGIKKEFRRTIKKKPKTLGKMSEKIKYSIWSFVLLLLSIPFYYAIVQSFLSFPPDPLVGWFIMSAISLSVPAIITVTYFKELEFLKKARSTKSAADVIKEYEGEKK
ncbi:MAG: glycosyltransferase [Candidatus Heimdallarchaeum aukensis]|uniref:Glycosyltransferase n=1 Tax=Candidatus Heimdallarchaeum aukensis TaxID=2876573 RepID=A0A9Y1BK10_9ARCH|nr:MAG: glycosyltransferase [Candidatus Heimdallarchaeum aukensis]